MSAISLQHIRKTYKEIIAVKDINLEVGDGELFGLIGPDGAGKTTIIRILTSLMNPDSGKAIVIGLNPNKDYKELRTKIGYMPGRFSLYQDLSVEENLSLFAHLFETTIEANYELVKDIYIQLEPFKDRKAGALSGGMKQKLALCCAMIHKPDILFLDEPTTGVDPVSRKEFWDMLKKLNKEGLTIFVSTPYMDEPSLCDRVALIQSGEILAIDTPEGINKLFEAPLFAVNGKNKYQLLKLLKDHPACYSAYSFGSEIHFTSSEQLHADQLEAWLVQKETKDVRVKAIKPGIEDTFMRLMTKTA